VEKLVEWLRAQSTELSVIETEDRRLKTEVSGFFSTPNPPVGGQAGKSCNRLKKLFYFKYFSRN
jgi:hypothetical protein